MEKTRPDSRQPEVGMQAVLDRLEQMQNDIAALKESSGRAMGAGNVLRVEDDDRYHRERSREDRGNFRDDVHHGSVFQRLGHRPVERGNYPIPVTTKRICRTFPIAFETCL